LEECVVVTLHEEIRAILLDHAREMTTAEIAREVNHRGNYHKKDGSSVTAFQVHGRTRNYDGIFIRRGSMVGLREWSPSGSEAMALHQDVGPATGGKLGSLAPSAVAAQGAKISDLADSSPLRSLPPVADSGARVLVLGTMPGGDSLRLQQYYAHPGNQFWRIAFGAFGETPPQDYGERIAFLLEHGIALWDVLKVCMRDGSLDSRIVEGSERPNDIAGFLLQHTGVSTIALNGGKACDLYQRLIAPTLVDLGRKVNAFCMPSTSSVHTVSIEYKLAHWRAMLVGGIA
jgi:double-stranded uracil-DNA glycosylase